MPAHIHPTITQFASHLVLRVHGIPSSSVSGCTCLTQNHRVPRVPLLGVGVTHYQDDFESHLRRYYSSFTARTDSCVRPYPSQRLGFPLYAGSLLSPVPAGKRSFPTLSLQSLYRCKDPYPAASLRCPYPFLPEGLRSHLKI